MKKFRNSYAAYMLLYSFSFYVHISLYDPHFCLFDGKAL